MAKHLSKKQEVNIINAYTVGLIPVVKLAEQYGLTRQGIYKVLWRNGIDTKTAGILQVSCVACGQVFSKHRSYVRKNKNTFCSMQCYYAYLEASQQGSYKQNRQGQRIARRVVSLYHELLEKEVVHHEDRNTLNNYPTNLRVFRTNGDHIRYHRLGSDYVEPVWSGRELTPQQVRWALEVLAPAPAQ